jgi:hypothetical protein
MKLIPLDLRARSVPVSPAERQLDAVERFLQTLLCDFEPDPPRTGPGRPRVLPALALWAGLLVCVLRGFTHQTDLWRLLRAEGLWHFPHFLLSDEAIYKRLEQGGTAPLETLFAQVSAALADRMTHLPPATAKLAPFATEIAAIDESTLDQVARTLPALRDVPAGDDRLLPGKLAGLFDLRRQQWRTVQFIHAPRQNEKVAARDLVEMLPLGSLVLADLGSFGFPWFDWLTDHRYYWVSRLRQKTSYEVIHTFYEAGETFDGLVWLGAYRADRAAHAVRLVRFRVGATLYQYITNVLDPEQLSLFEIARLYARRWDIELAFLLVKEHLHLHLLWSAKPVVIQQQVFAVLIISQILQALRQEIAWRADVDPFEVSMALLVDYLPRYAAAGLDPIATFVEHGRALRFIRPSRRTVIRAPAIPPDGLVPRPPSLVLQRTPRYAGRQ